MVIPAFQAENWINESIESALNSGSFSTEVVVVDDGSEDDTYKIASRYGNRVKVIRQKNSGVVVSRMTGANHAQGEYVKFLDADDLLPPRWTENIYSLAKAYPGEIFLTRVAEFSSSPHDLQEAMYKLGYEAGHLTLVRKEFLLAQATPSGSWVFPTELFKKFNFFPRSDVHLGEEYSFCLEVVKSKVPIRFADVIGYFVRNHDSTLRLSRTLDESRHLCQIRLIEECYQYIIRCIPHHSPAAIKQISSLCWARGRECLRHKLFTAARAYFELSDAIDPNINRPGSLIYQIANFVFGPIKSELIVSAGKKLIGK